MTNKPLSPITKSILIVEDHPIFALAIRGFLEAAFDHIDIYLCDSITDADYLIARGLEPDLVLLDLQLPDVDRMDGLIFLVKCLPTTPIFVLSGSNKLGIVSNCMDNGARGFIKKSATPEKIVNAIKSAFDTTSNDTPTHYDDSSMSALMETLTPREMLVLIHIKKGQSNKSVAFDLNVSVAAIKGHVSKILRKLNLSNRTEIVIFANSFYAKK